MEHNVYFSDNFFSAGITSIKDSDNKEIGSLDLKSAFSSRVALRDEQGIEMMIGYFRTFSSKWRVEDYEGNQLGILKGSWFSFSKKIYVHNSG